MDKFCESGPLAGRLLRGAAAAIVLGMSLGLTPFALPGFTLPYLPGALGAGIGAALCGAVLATAAVLSVLGRVPRRSALLAAGVVIVGAHIDGRFVEAALFIGVFLDGQHEGLAGAVAELSVPVASLALIAALRHGKTRDAMEDDALAAASDRRKDACRNAPTPRGRNGARGARKEGIVPQRVLPDRSDTGCRTPRPQPIQPLGTRRGKTRPERHVTPRSNPALREIRMTGDKAEFRDVARTGSLERDPLILTAAMATGHTMKPHLVSLAGRDVAEMPVAAAGGR